MQECVKENTNSRNNNESVKILSVHLKRNTVQL